MLHDICLYIQAFHIYTLFISLSLSEEPSIHSM